MAKMQAGSIAQVVHFASRLRPEAVESPSQTADHPGRSAQSTVLPDAVALG
jgi:hypothetical protein